LKQH